MELIYIPILVGVGTLIGAIIVTLGKEKFVSKDSCLAHRKDYEKRVSLKIENIEKGQEALFKRLDLLDGHFEKIWKFMGEVKSHL